MIEIIWKVSTGKFYPCVGTPSKGSVRWVSEDRAKQFVDAGLAGYATAKPTKSKNLKIEE